MMAVMLAMVLYMLIPLVIYLPAADGSALAIMERAQRGSGPSGRPPPVPRRPPLRIPSSFYGGFPERPPLRHPASFDELFPLNFTQIINTSDVKVLNFDQELVLDCVGSRPLLWSFTNATSEGTLTAASAHKPFLETRCTSRTHPFCLQIKIPKAQYYNTGKYVCGYTKEDLDHFKKSVYVYVYDPSYPILFQANRFYSVSATQKLVLPCLTTSPSLNVTLWKNFPPLEINEHTANMTFEPSVGFTFQNPPDFLDGEFSCRTTGGNVSFWLQYLAAGPPVITNVVNPYVVFSPDDDYTFELVCEGRHALLWDLPVQLEALSNSSSYIEIQDKRKGHLYVKTLKFILLDEMAAGPYTCRYLNSTRNTFYNVNSDSVFFFLVDGKSWPENTPLTGSLLIPIKTTERHVEIKRNGITYIPQCLSPILGLNMSFSKGINQNSTSSNRSEFSYVKIEKDSYWWFDPIRGIAINTTANSTLDLSGFFCCSAQFQGRSEEYCGKLAYETDSPHPLPEIVSSRNPSSVVGREVTLTCEVSKASQPNLTWIHPYINESRLFKSEVSVIAKHFYGAQYKIELTIKNLQMSDRGIYTCQYESQKDHFQKDVYYLDILDSTVVHLEPFVDNEKPSLKPLVQETYTKLYNITTPFVDSINLSVRMSTFHPRQRIKVAWTDEDEKSVQAGDFTEISNEDLWSNLTITTVVDVDSGLYNLSARVGEDTYSIAFLLSVPDELIQIQPPPMNLQSGQDVTLQCHAEEEVLGPPTWYLERNGELRSLAELNNDSSSSSDAVLYLGNISLSDSGNYLCRAKYKHSKHWNFHFNKTLVLIVTESVTNSSGSFYEAAAADELAAGNPIIKGGFADNLDLSSNEILSLTCKGTDTLFWEVQKSVIVPEMDPNPFELTMKEEVAWTDEGFYFANLTLTGVQPYDTGRYVCGYLENSDRLSSVYVFVKSPFLFLHNKIADGDLVVKRYYRNQTLVLPCRTTSADLNHNVTLHKDFDLPWTPSSSVHSISYDGTVGFTIWAPDEDMHGLFFCKIIDGRHKYYTRLFINDPGSSPVILNATEPYLIVPQDYDTVKLVCIGDHPVNWTYPSHIPQESRRMLKREELGTNVNGSVLTISAHQHDLTGSYSCVKSRNLDVKEHGLKSPLSSVFLLFPDEKDLFYPVSGKYIATVTLGTVNTFHPCIPTFPNVRTSLHKILKNKSSNSASTVSANICDCSEEEASQASKISSERKIQQNECKEIRNSETMYLDHTRGLVIDTRQPRNYSFLVGTYRCRAVKTATNKRSCSRKIQVELGPRKKILTIVPKAKEKLARGQDLHLTCHLNVEKGFKTHITWKYPFSSSRVVEFRTVEVREDEVLLGYSKRLAVRRLEMSDKGTYTCESRSQDGYLFTESYYLDIDDPSTVELELLEDQFNTDVLLTPNASPKSFTLYSRSGSTIKISVLIKVSGQENRTQLTWYKAESYAQLLQNENNVDITTDQNWSNLTLKDLQEEMVNTYKLQVKLGDAKDSVSVAIKIFKPPEISTFSSEDFFRYQEPFSFGFIVEAVPVMSVEITYYPADSITECQFTENAPAGLSVDPRIQGTKWIIQGSASSSRCYVCRANNTVGNDTKVFPFSVLKTEEAFSVSASSHNPYEGQELNLTCQVNSFSFDNPVWLVRQDDQFKVVANNTVTTPEFPTKNAERRVTSTKDSYTRSTTIHFDTVSLEDAGVYRCNVTRYLSPKETNVTVMDIPLDVMKVTAPVFPDNVTEEVVSEKDNRDYLNCTATGSPPFNVTWYMGPKLLSINENPELFTNNSFLLNRECLRRDSNVTVTCEVSNEKGSRLKRFHLTVHSSYDPWTLTKWMIRCNLSSWNPPENIKAEDKENGTDKVLYISLGLGIPFLLVILAGIIAIRNTIKSKSNGRSNGTTKKTFRRGCQPEESNIPFDINWEFPTNRLTMGPKIGQGAFGKVIRAQAAGIKEGEDVTTVAVKMLKPGANLIQKRALLEELKILILLGRHVNIVNLLGAVTKYMNIKGELFVIVEYCSRGSLRQFLIRHKKRFVNQLDPQSGQVNPEITTVTDCKPDYTNEEMKISTCSGSSGFAATFSSNEVDSHPSTVTGGATTVQLQDKDSGVGEVSATTENSGGYPGSHCKQLIVQEDQEDEVLTTSDLLTFAFQCSRGMEYLASRKLVHRDLATRNILLTSDHVIKICDFGLTKDVDYLYNKKADRKNTPLPVRWMAPEAVGQNDFTVKSDVWSFGIVLWEMFTLGLVPYPGVEINDQFYRRLLNGYRLDRPSFAPQEIYSIMMECWSLEPNARPNFVQLDQKLGELIESSTRQYYLDLNEPFEDQNNRDPNYQKLGEILEISVVRGDDLGELCGLPSLDNIEEEEEDTVRIQEEEEQPSSNSESSDERHRDEGELVHRESDSDKETVRNRSGFVSRAEENSSFEPDLPYVAKDESPHGTVNLESLEKQVYRM